MAPDRPGGSAGALSDEVFDRNAVAWHFFTFDEVEPDVFRTTSLNTIRMRVHSVYGGLIFAQALAAAEKTVPEKFRAHAAHSFFVLRVDYRVQRIRDGGSFCTRHVEAIQLGKIAFSMQISFHVKETGGLNHQFSMPQVKSPEESIEVEAGYRQLKKEMDEGQRQPNDIFKEMAKFRFLGDPRNIFETRVLDPEAYFGLKASPHPFTQYYWMKVKGRHNLDPKLARYIFAVQTDSTLVNTATRDHRAQGKPTSLTSSLDHNVWFHESKLPADDWILFESSSTIGANGRAFITGRMWSRSGRLLLSVTQEALVRTADTKAHI